MTKDAIIEFVDRQLHLPRWSAWRLAEQQFGAEKTYRAYLSTPEWRTKRDEIIKRAGGKCQCCMTADAWQVHHLSYRYKFAEPAWDLRAVCDPCHECMTAMDKDYARSKTGSPPQGQVV